MITILEDRIIPSGSGKRYIEGACLSTDSKPTDVCNGSTLIEMNTGKIFMFNEAGSAWVELQ